MTSRFASVNFTRTSRIILQKYLINKLFTSTTCSTRHRTSMLLNAPPWSSLLRMPTPRWLKRSVTETVLSNNTSISNLVPMLITLIITTS